MVRLEVGGKVVVRVAVATAAAARVEAAAAAAGTAAAASVAAGTAAAASAAVVTVAGAGEMARAEVVAWAARVAPRARQAAADWEMVAGAVGCLEAGG